MKEYLIGFFKDFEYESNDAACLLAAYDKIMANEDASQLLGEALAAYEQDMKLDYTAQILNRAKKIADIFIPPT